MKALAIVALIAVGLAAYWWLRRQRELVVLSVRHGKMLVVRGQASSSMLQDFAAALKNTERGEVEVLREDRGAQLYADGDIDEFLEQRLRNILRIHPAAAFRAPAQKEKTTLVRLLGFVWLAWFFNDRSS